ncbi:serine/threonine protein kinase [Piscinibacter gummiphilus]|uniref:non-specific serine/threonine protein kinase n=1 Tax=Piscinibacter gummiphilus TaxID=946333 RepID=A0ABZ0CYR0_9BURK|nr:protein kinase [Piscinibacter gummiphilus]WOB10028.1 protein kinase [Piscinibacter gummiphilus]
MDFGPTTQQFDPVTMHDALPAGTRLGGYQILEVLGRGGFGIVYLALDSSLQRQVAIKEYFPAELAMRCDDGQVWIRPGADPASYGAGMKAFLNEAKMLARFDHPSLARVLTFWEENRSAYMVMPYYEGRTLAKVLAEMKGPPDEAWLRSMLAPLLSALSTLHNANCLHLDISPDNILMLGDGRPVLLDFGVASRLATDKTMPLTALLNPAYAPIEQYSESINLQQGPWSDIYALAGVLHFAIAGVPPARATVRALEDPQRPLAETVAARAQQFPGLGYSATFLAAIDKALAVRPRDRPRGAAEFSLLLDRAAPQEPAPPEPAPPRHAPASGVSPGMPSGMVAEPLFAAEPMDAPPRPTRSRTPVWVASIAVIGLAAAGWTWLQRQPSFANITVSDLPPAVIANVPRPVAEGASAVVPLPTEPTAAGPDVAASGVAPVAGGAASATVVAQAASAAAAPAPQPAPEPAAKPAPAKPAPTRAAPTQPARVAKAAAPRVPPTLPPAENAQAAETTDDPPEEATQEAPAKPEPPAPARKPPPKATAALPPEPATPRAACGSRANFALVYCMQQQCKRWKFNNHPQCIEMERRGEL